MLGKSAFIVLLSQLVKYQNRLSRARRPILMKQYLTKFDVTFCMVMYQYLSFICFGTVFVNKFSPGFIYLTYFSCAL